MSFQAKDSNVLNAQLKVQEVVVQASDNQLYTTDSGDVIVKINEALDKAVVCIRHDDSAATLSTIAQADLIVSDSSAFTAGGDRKALRVNGVATLDANDFLIVKYIVQE